MRQTTYESCAGRADGCPTQQSAQAALAILGSALEQALESLRVKQSLSYPQRAELMQLSGVLKNSINTTRDEYTYDLATLLDLLILTALGSHRTPDGAELELIERSFAVLQRSLMSNETTATECARMTEEVWTWLGSNDGLPTKL